MHLTLQYEKLIYLHICMANLVMHSYVLFSSFEGMPSLPYVFPITSAKFNSLGGHMDIPEADFHILIPPNAVTGSNIVAVNVGTCTHGPFVLPKTSYRITDIFCVEADNKFSVPVTVTIPHCLELPEYSTSPDVIILQADSSSTNENGEYTFHPVGSPGMSSRAPHLSFELTEFCILCAVYQRPKSRKSNVVSQSSSTDSTGGAPSRLMRQMALDESTSSPSPQPSSSLDDENPSNFSQSPHPSSCQRQPCTPTDDSCVSSPTHSTGQLLSVRESRKRELPEEHSSTAVVRKRLRKVKYALIMFHPKDISKFPLDVYIYVCVDCYASVNVSLRARYIVSIVHLKYIL